MRISQRMRKAIARHMLDKSKDACYVLITCGQPSQDGKMEVELTYEGDLDLASYLVESAQEVLEGGGVEEQAAASGGFPRLRA